MRAEKISISLSNDEALVLFEWLSSLEDNRLIEGSAEQRVLWSLESSLEKVLVEPLKENYEQLLNAAKERVIAA